MTIQTGAGEPNPNKNFALYEADREAKRKAQSAGAGEPVAQMSGLSTPEGNEELAWEARWARKCERLQRELAETKAQRDSAVAVLRDLFKHCSMIHNQWGENCNQREADAAIAAARAVIR